MTSTLKLFLRMLAHGPETHDHDVHFHRGPGGTPAPCYDAGCPSPRLSV